MKPIWGSTRAGFDRAEALEAEVLEATIVDDRTRSRDGEVHDLVRLADFLAPELHRETGAEAAAAAVTEWADGDDRLLAEAARVARHEHHDDSARLLADAVDALAA